MKKALKNALKAYYDEIPTRKNNNAAEKLVLDSKIKLNSLSFAKPNMTFWQFFLTQIRFIRKRVWLGQFCALLFCGTALPNLSDAPNSIGLLSAVIPPVFLMGVGELSRAFVYNTAEMELSTAFTIKQIMMCRITILGLADVFALTCIGMIAFAVMSMNILRIFMYLCVPFLLTSFGCLYILNHIKSKDSNYYCIALGVMIMIVVFCLSKAVPSLYEASLISGWIIMFIISFACVAFECRCLLKSCTKQAYSKNLS